MTVAGTSDCHHGAQANEEAPHHGAFNLGEFGMTGAKRREFPAAHLAGVRVSLASQR